LVSFLLKTEDQDGLDSKIIASPISKIVDWSAIGDSNDFNPHLLNKLKHFIEHHKDLEKDKFVKIRQIGNKEKSKRKIIEAMENYKKYKNSHTKYIVNILKTSNTTNFPHIYY
jgi:inorganic pyrophosphatase